MAVQSHIDSLKTRHRELDTQIQELVSKAATDPVEINDLKRKKLQIKDRIRELSEETIN